MSEIKVMISQPMNGKTNEEIRKEREKIVEKINSMGWKLIDTIISEDAPRNVDEPIYYLAKSIEFISKVDIVIFMNGWQNARGCKIEHEICSQYEKAKLYENTLNFINKE